MKVLVLNGSPRGERSNTMQLTNAFLEGMRRSCSCETEVIAVCQKNIRDCLGCFCCWTKMPGKCVIQPAAILQDTTCRGADGRIHRVVSEVVPGQNSPRTENPENIKIV